MIKMVKRNIHARIKSHGLGLIAILGLLIAFAPISVKLFAEWTREEYSHGFLIPFLAALMAWHRMTEPPLKAKSAPVGLVWVLGSLVLLLISELSTFRQLGFFALVILTVGLSFLFVGKQATKKAMPAFVLLLFAIPLPFMIHNNLSFHLKSISSDLGVNLLQFMGLSVYQEGNVIDLGHYKLQVVDACNGLRYLFPAACFSYLIAYLVRDVMWKRCVIFLSFIPITIGMNALRIAVVGVTVNIWGTQAAEGFTHLFEGYVVFLLCIALIMALTLLLLRIGKAGSLDWGFFTLPEKPLSFAPLAFGKVGVTLLLLSLVSVALPFVYFDSKKETASAPIPMLQTLPLSIQQWTGARQSINPTILKDLTLSDYFLADYKTKKDFDNINLYIAYYASQEIGSAAHSPATCVPGGGWKIDSINDIDLPEIDHNGAPLTVSRMVISLGSAKQVMYYWFEGRGRNITSQIAAKWYLMIDSLISGRSDGALVRVTTPLDMTEEESAADERLKAFLIESYPLIKERFKTP